MVGTVCKHEMDGRVGRYEVHGWEGWGKFAGMKWDAWERSGQFAAMRCRLVYIMLFL